MEFLGPRRPGSNPPLHITAHGFPAQARQLAQDLRPLSQDRDVRRVEPAIAAGPAPGTIVFQPNAHQPGLVCDQAFGEPAVAAWDPGEARWHDPCFTHWSLQDRFDVPDANRHDQVCLLQYLDVGTCEIEGMTIGKVEGGALLEHGQAQQLSQRL